MKSLLEIIKRSEIQSILLWCTVIWLCVSGGNIYLLPLVNPDQLQNSYLTGGYFLTAAGVAGWYYKTHIFFPHHGTFSRQFIPAAVFTLLLFALLYYLNIIFPLTPQTAEKITSSKFFFPLFRTDTFIAKLGDITFQQVVTYGVLKKLKEQNLSNREALSIFMGGFFLIHLPLVFSLKWYAFVFIVPSIGAGGLFAYLILNFRYGFFKSYAIHFLFYLAVGLYFRV
jgi:hypothetical protein